jgi:hypothetical protein
MSTSNQSLGIGEGIVLVPFRDDLMGAGASISYGVISTFNDSIALPAYALQSFMQGIYESPPWVRSCIVFSLLLLVHQKRRSVCLLRQGIGPLRVLGTASLAGFFWRIGRRMFSRSVSKCSDNAVLYACTERTTDCRNVDPFVPVVASSCSHKSDKNFVKFTKS